YGSGWERRLFNDSTDQHRFGCTGSNPAAQSERSADECGRSDCDLPVTCDSRDPEWFGLVKLLTCVWFNVPSWRYDGAVHGNGPRWKRRFYVVDRHGDSRQLSA